MSGATEWRLHWGPRTKLCFFVFLLLNMFFCVVGVYQVFYLLFIMYSCVFYFILILFYYFYYFCSFYCFSMHNYSYLSRIYVNMNIIQVRFLYIHVVPTLR